MSEPGVPELPEVERAAERPAPARGLMAGSLAAAVLSLLLFAWLADEVFEGDTACLDTAARGWFHRLASPDLTRVMTLLSLLGYEALIVAVVVALAGFALLRWRRAAGWLAITMAGALVLDITLKTVFHRARPEPFFGPAPQSYSFPSGHSLVAFCFYGVMAGLVTARVRASAARALCWSLAAALVVAIGVSRIYLGVHYASDVIAGYLAAAMWVGAMVGTDRWRKRRKS